MISADKQVLLTGFLGTLPGSVAARLAKAVEVDRLIGGTDLPHDEILRALRPRLRESSQRFRMATPLRFFCRPFEDLLVSAQRDTKQKGRIARTSIELVWTWLSGELIPHRHRELGDAMRDAILYGRDKELEQKTAELWAESAAALKAALSGEKKQATAAKKLGGVAAMEDAQEMALLLGGAPRIAELQTRLPKPIGNLTEDDLAFLRDIFDRLSESDADLAPYVALIILGRLERPWEALRLVAALSRKTTDTLISNTDLGIVGELLFSDLDMHVRRIQAVHPPDFDPEPLVSSLAGFTELSSGMVKELAIRRDGKWGQRLAKDRGAVAQVLEDLLERAPKEIIGGLPTAKVGSFAKGPKPLDLSRVPDPDRVAKAMRYAQLMVHSRPFAVAAAFNAKLTEAFDQTAASLRTYGEDILRELRAAPAEKRTNVDAHFAVVLQLCTLVLGQEETDFLRRRARVPATA